MPTKLNILIGLHLLIALMLAVLIRLEFTQFYASLSAYRQCDWNWSDGMSAQDCRSRQLRRSAGMPVEDSASDRMDSALNKAAEELEALAN